MKYLKWIFSFVFFIHAIAGFSQERPPIKVFAPKDYLSEPQNWSITQSAENYIYVANNEGLLEYNGANWQLYKSPNNTIIRVVKHIDSLIYTGCNNDFGYWKKNEYGQLHYTSLSKKLKIKFLKDEEFWNIIDIDDYILFQSLQRIFIYSKQNKSYSVIGSKTGIHKIFKVDNAIYFQKDKDGLYKIQNGVSIVVCNDLILQNNIIVNVFNYHNTLLIQTENAGFFTLDNTKLVSWQAPINKLISNYNFYRSIKLKDHSYVLGTTSNGILHVSAEGKLLSVIDKINGLSNNTIHHIFEDAEGNVWLALNNGINCINFNSPFSIYNDKRGTLGTVHASAVFKNTLYLGTNQGLFFRPIPSKDDFKCIEGTQGAVWCLTQIGDELFCGHNSGTFVISNNKAEKIVNVAGTWNIKPINKNTLLQGNYDGLYVLQRMGNAWVLKNKLQGFNISSRFFEIGKKDQIFVSHEYLGLFHLSVNKDFTKVLSVDKVKINGNENWLYSSLLKYNNQILFSSKNGVYLNDNQGHTFVKDRFLSTLFTKDDYTSGKLVFVKESNKLWSFSKNNLNYITPSKFSSAKKIERIPITNTLDLGYKGYENITYLADNKYLMGTLSGYVVIDLNKIIPKNHSISINTINNYTIGKSPKIVSKHAKGFFKNKDNYITFSYSVPEFQKYLDAEYQYFLEGFYSDWSSWSTNSAVTFENLPYGTYTFKVRAKFGNSYSNNTETYSFTIDKPWYLQNVMLVTYVLLVLIFSLFMHMFYKRYYKKQRERLLKRSKRQLELKELENQKQLMHFNNEKLRQEIESKSRELGISTMSLINKNETLNEIKKVIESVQDLKDLKKVNKIIDENLSDTSDWNMFEEAFNNADKDFLKKMKHMHPDLTPNDLRLCAYLRLNLSSKEIAPLLSISPKSVEVKRYRLRKKLNLEHEDGLIEYILQA